MEDIALCQKIEAELRKEKIAYGNPDKDSYLASLWRISPRHFPISAKRWKGKENSPGLETAVKRFVDFYRLIRKRTRAQVEPFYFRLDATITADNANLLTEWNLVPVGEGGVEVNRRLYTDLVPMPSDFYNPFPGNIAVLAEALRWYGGKKVVILIPNSRRNYTRDYFKTVQMLQEQGINIRVDDKYVVSFHRGALRGDTGKIDVVFRVFQKDALRNEKELPCGSGVSLALKKKKVRMFPPFSPLESKESMAWIFSNRELRELPAVKALREFIPWTWPVDPDNTPVFKRQSRGWWQYFMSEKAREEGFVLKPCGTFGSREVVFSKDVEVKTWRKALGKALVDWVKGEKWIIQKMIELKRFSVTFYQPRWWKRVISTIPAWGTRFCITGVWIPGSGTKIGDVDVTLRQGRLIHQQPDCVFVPVLIGKA